MQSIFAPDHPAPANSDIGPEPARWYVYILRCADNTLYTGVTTDLFRRVGEHNSPAGGARYTRTRKPVRLVHAEHASCRSEACRREHQIKRMTRDAKEALLTGSSDDWSRRFDDV